MANLPLSNEDRTSLALTLSRECDQSQIIRNTLGRRWDRNYQIYYADETATSLNVIEGIGNYPFSLWRGKCDKLVGDLCNGLFSAYPVVQCIQEGPDGANEDSIEKALAQLADAVKFDRVYPKAAHQAANTNIGAMRIRPTQDGTGKVTGLEADWFEPKHFMAYPSGFEHIEKCKTVGHRFYDSLWDIEQLQKDGTYYKTPIPIIGGDNPDQYVTIPGRFDINQNEGVVDIDDSYVECWEVITRMRVKGKWRRVIVVFARSSMQVLSCQDYEYARPWYSIVRLCQTEKRIFTNDSVANSVQGYCLAAQDMMNFIVAGACVTAMPIVWMAGYIGPTQAKKWTPGEVFHLASDGKAGVLTQPFDAEKFQGILEKFEALVDATIGISRLGTSQNLPVNTKATAINAIMAGDERRQATYLDAAAESVEECYGLLLMYLQDHYGALKKAYGGDVAEVDLKTLNAKYRLEVTGRSGASNPNTLLQKLQMLLEMAQDPNSPFDASKLQKRAASTMEFPFSVDGLEKDWQTELMAAANGLKQVGMDPMSLLELGAHIMEAQAEASAQQAAINGQTGDPNGPSVPGMAPPAGIPAGAPGITPQPVGNVQPGIPPIPSGGNQNVIQLPNAA